MYTSPAQDEKGTSVVLVLALQQAQETHTGEGEEGEEETDTGAMIHSTPTMKLETRSGMSEHWNPIIL